MTAGVINTKILKLWFADAGDTVVAVTCLTSASFDLTLDTFDLTCKDSGDFYEFQPGTISGELSGELYVSYDATNGHDEIAAALLAKTLCDWEYGTGVSGDTVFSGSGYFTAFGVTSDAQNQGAKASFTLKATGTITQDTY